jgi:uncharacterized protein YacL
VRERDNSVPHVVTEILRFCVVVFLAAAGYEVSRGLSPAEQVLGPFDAGNLGLFLGSAFGYVLGGLVARLTFRTVAATESALSGKSAEQLLAGLTGAVLGVLVAGALAWPMLLVGDVKFTGPLFIFVVVTVGSLFYRLGLVRRDGVLALLGRGTLEGQRAAALPRIVDTSVAIDGRVLAVVRAGFLHGRMLVPEPVLGELQGMADSSDEQRRAKGRRGLDVLESLRAERGIALEVFPDSAPGVAEVDAKLVQMSLSESAALLTLDTNLARVASVAGCRVMNLHALALALRPPVIAGDSLTVLLTRPGKESGQAVGYLDDGTMVVVERARERLGTDQRVVVSSVLVTVNGRLVFARPSDDERADVRNASESASGSAPGPVPSPATPSALAAIPRPPRVPRQS